MEIKDRFKMIMDRERLSISAFAESIGVSQATISHIMSGRNRYPSTDVILRLRQRYADISLEWLLTGHGNMTADSSKSNFPQNDSIPSGKNSQGVCANSTDMSMVPTTIECGIEKPHKRIIEIRVFFDDNTFEIFRPVSL